MAEQKIIEEFAERQQALRESRNKAKKDFAERQQVLRESRNKAKKDFAERQQHIRGSIMNEQEKKEPKTDLAQGAKAVVEMVKTITDNPNEQVVLLDAVAALLLSNGCYSAHVAFTARTDR